MTYDATTNLLLPPNAKADWGRKVLAAGGGTFPEYPSTDWYALPPKMKALAKRQWVVFQNGPYSPIGEREAGR
jgi:hypothetical protein